MADFENNSLGRQSTDDPFTSSNQCEWKNFTTGHSAWLIASFAPGSAADEVRQNQQAECQGQESVSGLGDVACYPLYTGQLRVVKGSTYLDFFADKELGDDMKAGMKMLAEKALGRLP